MFVGNHLPVFFLPPPLPDFALGRALFPLPLPAAALAALFCPRVS